MKNPFSNFFTPGPRGKLRWALFGILLLFIATVSIDIIGVPTTVTRSLDQGISAIPGINSARVWPEIQRNPLDNSRSVKWKTIKEIDLATYGWPFRLGLDLLGGAHLVYDANVSQITPSGRADAVSGVRDVIERRVNALGVSEPLVQTNQVGDKWRVLVELAGVYDVNQAIKIIGETPLLQFKEENPQNTGLTPEQQKKLDELNSGIEKKAQGILDQILKGADFATLAKANSQDPGSKDNGGLYTGVKRGAFVPEYDKVLFDELKVGQVYPKLVKTQFGYHIIKKEAQRGEGDTMEVDTRHILLTSATPSDIGVLVEPQWKNTPLTGKQLKKAVVEFDQTSGVPQVVLEFDTEGSKLFGEITERNSGKLVAIFLDGQAISIPRVNEAIYSGRAVISGNFDVAEAKQLAQRLNAGALPVPVTLVSQTTIGASLGSESIQKSLIAGLLGFLVVAVFMILYYRLPGLLAVIALLMYVSIALAVFKLASITLTLAGIAGFILSVGMAVDANVLIFERLKEELRAGRDLSFSVREGFHRAWNSIRDSNASSLITCAILFWFGSSVIRGFALTLAIGIVVSMFSAITITRNLLQLVIKWKFLQSRWLYGVKR